MHLDTQILRAIARLSRQGRLATLQDLELRVSAEPEALRAGLARLAQSSLVTRRGGELRLTLFGLAVAVATAARRSELAPRAALAETREQAPSSKTPRARRTKSLRAA